MAGAECRRSSFSSLRSAEETEMSDSPLEQAKHAWQSTYDGFSQEQHDRHVLGFAVLVRGIAERGAVSSDELASEIGVEPSQA